MHTNIFVINQIKQCINIRKIGIRPKIQIFRCYVFKKMQLTIEVQ